MFKLELKTPDNEYKASKKQQLNLRRWKRSGAITGVVYSMRFLRKHINANPIRPGSYAEDEANGCQSWIDIPEV